jgi:hypothetical protein
MEKGIVLYTIESNGCLNGVYTNDDLGGVIFTETAKRQPTTADAVDRISGTYDAFYFDRNTLRNNTRLIISNIPGAINRYTFTWRTIGATTDAFVGEGYIMNDRQVAVAYREV